MSNHQTFGIGPMIITDLPAIKAHNERKRQDITASEQLPGLVIPHKHLTPAECLALWAKQD